LSRNPASHRRITLAALTAVVLALSTLFGTAMAQVVGGRLVIGRSTPPSTLDAQKTGEVAAYDVLALVGGALMSADPETLAVTPNLAESYELSADSLTYTFHLRQGVTFHNGDPLTSADFKYTFERALDPATESVVSGDLLSAVTSIETPDASTLVITLEGPSPVFLRNLGSAYLQPLSKRAVESVDPGQHPVGVGPYRFKDWVAGYSITLERNPDFAWPTAPYANRGPAYPDEIEFRYIPEQGTRVAALEVGEIDVTDVSAGDLFLFEGNTQFYVFSSLRSGIGRLFLFNMNDPVMSDLRVRQAFSHAVDKQFFIDTLVEGRAIPATSALPPSLPGYDPASSDTDYDFDREAAAALLDEAGWKLGAGGVREKDGQKLSVRIVAYTDTAVMQASELLQSQLKAIGVDATLESYERSLQMPMLIQGDFQVAPLGWAYDDPDILYILYHSSQHPNGLNLGAVSDQTLDKVLEAGRTTVDDSQRMLAYHEAQRIINEEAYIIPVYVEEVYTVSRNNVHDLRFDALGGMMLHDAWVQDR